MHYADTCGPIWSKLATIPKGWAFKTTQNHKLLSKVKPRLSFEGGLGQSKLERFSSAKFLGTEVICSRCDVFLVIWCGHLIGGREERLARQTGHRQSRSRQLAHIVWPLRQHNMNLKPLCYTTQISALFNHFDNIFHKRPCVIPTWKVLQSLGRVEV